MRLAILSAILILLCVSSLHALDRRGLMLYLPFDEGRGDAAKDMSGCGNNGKLIAGAEWVEGKFGKAVHLVAAGDYVQVPHSDSLDIKQDITMEVWALVDSMGPTPYCSFITKCTGDQIGAYMLHVDGSAGAVAIDPLVFINNTYAQWPSARATVPFGEWHHIAASYDGREYRTFVDGELKATFQRSPGGKLDHSDAPVAIGRDNRYAIPGDRFMDCTLDEVRIWSRVLTESEIREAMTGVLLSVMPKVFLADTWGQVKKWW